jgi:DNA-binding transcriptional regulator YiaG
MDIKKSQANQKLGYTPSPEMISGLRKRHKLTQTEFGNIGSYSLRAVQDWESGKRKMHPLTWMAYQHMLGEIELVRG